MEKKLQENLEINFLDIEDESSKHIGHAGFKEGGETHFKVKISSSDFDGLNKVKSHKLIYNILKKEMEDQIHALSIEIL